MSSRRKGQRYEAGAKGVSGRPQSRLISVADLLSGLSNSAAEALLKTTQDQRYDSGSYVYELGEHQQGFYLLKTGLVEEFRLTEGGNKLPIGQIIPGGVFGLSSVDKHYCCFAEALDESTVGFLSFQRLEGICRDFPTLACNLVQALMLRLGEIEERVELVAFSGVRARVGWALLGLSAIHGSALVGFTHEALATWAVCSRPKVSQVLEELQWAGMLRLGRGRIEISDLVRLEEWAKQAATSP